MACLKKSQGVTGLIGEDLVRDYEAGWNMLWQEWLGRELAMMGAESSW
jgi:hypothetical protein